jgi:23S rRNA (cytosine1962-C5)-methyltransferase
VRRGHPWVYRDGIQRMPDLGAGATVLVKGPTGQALGIGVYDPSSPLAVRMWSASTDEAPLALLDARLTAALATRATRFAPEDTTAYRVLNGEGDRTPGIVIDRYGACAVLRTDGDGAAALADAARSMLEQKLRAAGVTALLRKSRGTEVEVLFGDMPDGGTVVVREHGVPFLVDLARGQKTGAFLDQRDNRRRVGALVASRNLGRVLNLFSYAGGFSLHAARAGAKTTSVDIAAQAHATAQRSFREAGLTPVDHEFVSADVFAFLDKAKGQGRTWDLVISDPPSFAPNERSVAKALGSYRNLHRACVGVLAPGGVFCASSCSSHVPMEAFLSTLDDEALGGHLRLTESAGPPSDHPTLPAFPEGRYLKFCVLE